MIIDPEKATQGAQPNVKLIHLIDATRDGFNLRQRVKGTLIFAGDKLCLGTAHAQASTLSLALGDASGARPVDCKREIPLLAKHLFSDTSLSFNFKWLFIRNLMIKQPPTSEILIATRNAGKIREYQSLLASLPFQLRSLTEFPDTTEVEETGLTFSENAVLKAKAYAEQTGLWTLADDSGLEVEALGGAPGIFSARYGGEMASDADRVELLLAQLQSAGAVQSRARFVCVIAIADPQAQIQNISVGECVGVIAHAPRGTNGFGYDPVFVPDGYEKTFGELPTEIKEQISHRALALKAARAFLLSDSPDAA